MLSRFDLPRTVVSVHKCTRSFSLSRKKTGLRTVPYHSQSNGLAGRAVWTIKLCKNPNGTLQGRLDRIQCQYRRTPLPNGETMLLGLAPRCLLDNIVSCSFSDVDTECLRTHQVGDPTWYRNYRADGSQELCKPPQDSRMATIQAEDSELHHRHNHQLKAFWPATQHPPPVT